MSVSRSPTEHQPPSLINVQGKVELVVGRKEYQPCFLLQPAHHYYCGTSDYPYYISFVIFVSLHFILVNV